MKSSNEPIRIPGGATIYTWEQFNENRPGPSEVPQENRRLLEKLKNAPNFSEESLTAIEKAMEKTRQWRPEKF